MELLFTLIKSITTWLNELSGGNPFMATAILAGAVYLLRNVPVMIVAKLKSILVYRVYMNNADTGVSAFHTTNKILTLFKNSHWAKYVKSHSVNESGKTINESINIGLGEHYFYHEGAMYLLDITASESKSGKGLYYTLNISTFIWNKAKLNKLLVDTFPMNYDCPSIYVVNQFGQLIPSGRILPFYGNQKQMVDDKIYTEIDTVVSRFVNNPNWYNEHGFKYKETFLLYGEPGTGKTTLVRHIASKYNIPILVITAYTLNEVQRFISQQSDKHQLYILLIEEIDACNMLKKKPELSYENASDRVKIDKSDYLNYFDGVAPLENVLIFKTTNRIEELDSSIYRPGRVDHLINITYPTKDRLIDIIGWDNDDERSIYLKTLDVNKVPLATIAKLRLANTTDDIDGVLNGSEHYFKLLELSGTKYFNHEDMAKDTV